MRASQVPRPSPARAVERRSRTGSGTGKTLASGGRAAQAASSKKDTDGGGSDVFNTNVSAVYFTKCVARRPAIPEGQLPSILLIRVAFLPLLQAGTKLGARHSASVIVISSISGLMAHAQGHFGYNAAKGATVHLSKLMSAEFAKASIRVNSIAPGYFPSEMTAKESDERQKSHLPDEKIQEKGHVPAGRAGSDEEMAQAVVRVLLRRFIVLTSLQIFLARNAYVNGEVIAVDGGTLLVLPGSA